MNMAETTDHTLSGPSMTYVQMEALIDLIAGKCMELDSEIISVRNALGHMEKQATNLRGLVSMVRSQVEAGTMAAEAAVVMLSGQRSLISERRAS